MDSLLSVLIEPDRTEVHAVYKEGVPKEVFDTIEGVTVE